MQTLENEHRQLVKYTSISITAYVLLMLAASLTLIFIFDFPDILREPIGVMLSKFYSNKNIVVPSYYLFVLTGICFVFMVILIHKSIVPKDSTLGLLALVSGILFGVLSNLGFIRWPFLINFLAITFNDPSISVHQKETIEMIFNSFHNYAGVAVGENFAFWFEGFWMIFISIIIKQRSDLFPKYMGIFGLILGSSMLVYTFEQFGGLFSFLGVINVPIHAGLLVWLIAIIVLFQNFIKQNSVAKLGRVNVVVLILLYFVLVCTAII